MNELWKTEIMSMESSPKNGESGDHVKWETNEENKVLGPGKREF